VLPTATRVLFTVNRVSPDCTAIGHFTVAGHAGLNRVRFANRFRGRVLEPGTYRISARTPDGGIVRRVTLVVVDGPAPTREELRTLRAENVCASDNDASSFGTASTSSGPGSGASAAAGTPAQALPSAGSPDLTPSISAPDAPDISGGVLASSVEKTARAVRPILVALLLIAIVLLALASVPRVAVAGGRTNDMLARHRAEIAGLGAVALVATAVAFLLS
jgi:hypothetical protein